MTDFTKYNLDRRETPAYKEKLGLFREKLETTMRFMPRDAESRIENEEDRAFLRSMLGDRSATMAPPPPPPQPRRSPPPPLPDVNRSKRLPISKLKHQETQQLREKIEMKCHEGLEVTSNICYV